MFLTNFRTVTYIENCAFPGYYAASSGDLLQTFRDKLLAHLQGSFGFLNPEDGTDMLYRIVRKKLPLLAT
jgi:hypothetical protein